MSSFQKILKLIAENYNVDFTGYKENSIKRRLKKRIDNNSFKTYKNYLEFLHKNPTEIEKLYNELLIGVTEFYRDRKTFETYEKYFRNVVANKKPNEPIRIWSVGCATGEEPYSIALIIKKVLGEEIKNRKIRIFSTDINNNALNYGRNGIYSHEEISNLYNNEIDLAFRKKGNKYEIENDLKQMMLFSKHDITNDPPFINIDIILCRNLLIYLIDSVQKHVFSLLHYSLNQNGYLCLGKSEGTVSISEVFTSIDSTNKIFQKKRGTNIKVSLPNKYNKKVIEFEEEQEEVNEKDRPPSFEKLAKDTIYQTFEHPFVILNENYDILEVTGNVSPFIGIRDGEINVNILKLIHEDMHLELHSLKSKVEKTGLPNKSAPIPININNNKKYIQLHLKPIIHSGTHSGLNLLIFQKIEGIEKLDPKIKKEQRDQRIIELEHELAAAKDHLQNFTEELQMNKEELQSLNEELQSKNEELKSSNEELETSNEELQSANEELNETNKKLEENYQALKEKNEQLEKANIEIKEKEKKLKNIVETSHTLIWSVDEEGRWTYINEDACKKIYGYSPNELLGTPFIDILHKDYIDRDLKVFENLKKAQPIYNLETVHLTKNNKEVYLLFNAIPLYNEKGEIIGTTGTALDITEKKKEEKELQQTKNRLEILINSIDGIFWECDAKTFQFTYVSKQTEYILGHPVERWYERDFWPNHIHEEDRDWVIGQCYKATREGRGHSFEYRILDKNNNVVWLKDIVSVFTDRKGEPVLLRGVRFNINEQKKREKEISELNQNLENKVKERTRDLEKANEDIKALLAEMHHRVKNNLQVVTSLLRLRADKTNDEQLTEIIDESQQKIKSISLIHETLYNSNSVSGIKPTKYIRYLVEERIEIYNMKDKVSCEIDIPDYQFTLNTMVPLGLLLNELILNSLKHAFKNRDSNGMIKIMIKKNDQNRNRNEFNLFYSDNGKGFKVSEEANSNQLGLQLIESFINQLDGSYNCTSDSSGTAYKINFQMQK